MGYLTITNLQAEKCESVHGEWSEWSVSDDQCTLEEGSWTRPRTRTCTNPEPKYGGENCHADQETGETTEGKVSIHGVELNCGDCIYFPIHTQ